MDDTKRQLMLQALSAALVPEDLALFKDRHLERLYFGGFTSASVLESATFEELESSGLAAGFASLIVAAFEQSDTTKKDARAKKAQLPAKVGEPPAKKPLFGWLRGLSGGSSPPPDAAAAAAEAAEDGSLKEPLLCVLVSQ